jgi:hypothetical protein
MLNKAIYNILSNDAGVTAITTDIYFSVAPQQSPNPSVVFNISVDPEDDKDGVSSLDIADLQVDIYCDRGNLEQLDNLYTAVRAALDRNDGTHAGMDIELSYDGHDSLYDDIADAHRISIDFTIRHKR